MRRHPRWPLPLMVFRGSVAFKSFRFVRGTTTNFRVESTIFCNNWQGRLLYYCSHACARKPQRLLDRFALVLTGGANGLPGCTPPRPAPAKHFLYGFERISRTCIFFVLSLRGKRKERIGLFVWIFANLEKSKPFFSFLFSLLPTPPPVHIFLLF